MTGGHEDKCQELLDVLYEYVDSDGDCVAREELRRHVEECPHCLQALGLEQQVRQLLRSCCSQPAPQELRARITTQLRVHYEVRRFSE